MLGVTVLVMVPWPWLQEHAHAFYVVKGLVALATTVLVIWHMSATWNRVTEWAQRLRYLSLLALVAVITCASPEQAADGIPVSWRNLTALLAVVLVAGAMVVSVVVERRHRDD